MFINACVHGSVHWSVRGSGCVVRGACLLTTRPSATITPAAATRAASDGSSAWSVTQIRDTS